MKRRREHIECESRAGGRGCIVLGTPICTSKKKGQAPWAVIRRWMWSFANLYTALCCFVLVAIVAIGIGMFDTVVDVGAYLALTSMPGTSPSQF
jgi:hypothetical protein